MAFVGENLADFGRGACEMDARLRSRLTLGELFGLTISLVGLVTFIGAYALLGIEPFDYGIYLKTAGGNLEQYYYADWFLPVFRLLAWLPWWRGYLLWGLLNLGGVFVAGRIFGGPRALVLCSFQALSTLASGQVTGLLVGCLALGWWAMAHHRWELAGLGFFLASAKFQIGLPFGFLLLLAAEVGWRARLRALLLPAALSILSLVASPAWPLALWERIAAVPPYDWGCISLWRWLGPGAMLIWLPPLLLPLARRKRFLALAAAVPLALPYFQQADLLALFVLPVGWLPALLGNLGFLYFEFLYEALPWLWVAPLSLYLAITLPALAAWLRQCAGRMKGLR
ncbi:MAG: hypothetical protein FJZ96_06440 [Chloroflexi bacterium]|nr:hypothetical protein [Chloroflexota bacterium]